MGCLFAEDSLETGLGLPGCLFGRDSLAERLGLFVVGDSLANWLELLF